MKRNSNRLRSLELRGFKSIPYQHPLKLEFGDINILLGANGAGKSNIISFFKMLGYMMSGSLQRFIAESGTNQKFLYYGAKKTPTMYASLRFEALSFYDFYSFSLTAAVPDRLILTSEDIEWKHDREKRPFKSQLQSDFNESALVKSGEKSGQRILSVAGPNRDGHQTVQKKLHVRYASLQRAEAFYLRIE